MDDHRDKPQMSEDGSRPPENSTQLPGSTPIEIRQSQSDSSRQSSDPIPLDRIIKTANTMSSMMMAHKIALEDDFKLEPGMDISGPLMSISPIIGSSPAKGSPEPTLQSRVKDIVHDAYWDLFKEELIGQASENKEDRKYDISKQLLRDARQKIIDLLLPQHTRLRQDIEDKLDSQILDQLSRVESLDLVDYAKYILSVLSKLCAPVRDEMLRELSETTDVVQLYRGIMELLELMRLDFANFTLNRFKPHIKAHSQEYEREKFSEILKQQQSIGIDGLEYTRIWLSRAVQKVDAIHGLADLINDSEELNSSIMTSNADCGTRATYTKEDKILKSEIINKVLNAGYCELLEWSPEKQKLYPETLLFDEATFKQLGEQYKILVLTSSILLTTFAIVNRCKIPDTNEFRVLAKSNVITLLTASYDEDDKLETIYTRLFNDIKEIDPTFESQAELFKGQILDIGNSSNRIKELARRRILEFVETLLTLDMEHQKFPSKSMPPVNIPLGLNCLSDEITLTMAQLVKIIRYNRRVFFQHYQDIIVELVSKSL